MRSGTGRGVSKWLRHNDRYIGRLYSDIGKVPSDSGIFWSTGELREYGKEVLGLNGPEWEGEAAARRWRAPLPSPVRIGQGVWGAAPLSLPSPLPPFPPFS